MSKKRTYYPPTTTQQRRLLFETWKATGNVSEACLRSHVSERTFYNWKPRFEAGGYAALEKTGSHAPKNPRRTPREVTQEVEKMKRAHPEWGKRRIADEMAKANNWVPLVSSNSLTYLTGCQLVARARNQRV
jgi:transposase